MKQFIWLAVFFVAMFVQAPRAQAAWDDDWHPFSASYVAHILSISCSKGMGKGLSKYTPKGEPLPIERAVNVCTCFGVSITESLTPKQFKDLFENEIASIKFTTGLINKCAELHK